MISQVVQNSSHDTVLVKSFGKNELTNLGIGLNLERDELRFESHAPCGQSEQLAGQSEVVTLSGVRLSHRVAEQIQYCRDGGPCQHSCSSLSSTQGGRG